MGALAATFVGYSVTGLPIYVHLPLVIISGMLGGQFGEPSQVCSKPPQVPTRSSTRL